MTGFRAITVAVSAFAVFLLATTARTEDSDAMSRGLEFVRAFEYDAAIAQFQSVVEDDNASAADRLHALERIAAVYLNTDRQDEARETFQRLIDASPGHELRERAFPPQVQRFFRSICSAYEPQPSARVDVRITDLENGLIRLEAVVLDGPGVDRAVAYVRTSETMSYREISLDRNGNVHTDELQTPSAGEALEYYVELLAPSGQEITSEGSADEPLTFEPAPVTPVEPIVEPPRRFYRTWWFWTVIGVVVAAGTATAIVVPLTVQDEPPAGSLGTGRLE